MAVDGVSSEPFSGPFPANREIYREFHGFWPRILPQVLSIALYLRELLHESSHYCSIPNRDLDPDVDTRTMGSRSVV